MVFCLNELNRLAGILKGNVIEPLDRKSVSWIAFTLLQSAQKSVTGLEQVAAHGIGRKVRGVR